MGTTIDSLEIQIEQNSTNATKGLDSLADSLGKLKNASKGGLGLGAVKNQISNLNEALKGVDDSSVEKLNALATTLEKLSSLGNLKISPSLANGITKLATAMDSISLSSVENLEDTVNALERMGGLGSVKIPRVTQPTGATTPTDTTGATPGVANAGNVSDAVSEVNRYTDSVNTATRATGAWKSQLTQAASTIKSALGGALKGVASGALNLVKGAFSKATTAIKSFAKNIKNAVGAKISSGLKGLSGGFKGLAQNLGFANTRLGHFITSLGRIAMYRAVRFIISQFTQAIKDGVNNLYQWSKVANGEFAQSMDRLASSTQYLKNSLGAMVSPLINALAPAIDMIIGKLVTLINLVNQFFARLSGAKTFTAAKKQATEYAAAASDAGKATKKAAKEIKDATLGIDELNIISPNDDDDSGSSGGGSKIPNYADMFETLPIDSDVSNFVDKLKELFNNGDWEGLGRLLGSKFNEIMDSIDWNGIGHKLGYYLNGAIQTAYYFLDEVDWNRFGGHIAELMNGALEEIDFKIAGRLWTKKFTVILDTIIGFLGKLNWSLVGKSIGDFVRGACDEAFDWITGYDWGQMADKAYKSLKDLIKGIDFASVAQSFFKALGAALAAAVSFIATFVADIWADINAYFQKYVTNDDGTKKTGLDWVKGILKGIWEGIKSIGKWIYDNVFTPFIDGFKAAFGIHSPSTVMEEQGKYIVQGLINGISSKISDCIAKVLEWANKIKEWFVKGDDGKNMFDHFKEYGQKIVSGFKDKVSTTYTTVKSSMITWATKVKEWYTGDSEGAVNLRTFATFANNTINGFKDKIGSAYTNTKSNIITWASSVKDWFTSSSHGGVNNNNWQTFANNVIEGFKTKIGNAYTNTKSNIITWATSVKSWFTEMGYGGVNNTNWQTFANNVIEGFKTKIGNAYTNTKSNMVTWANNVKSWFSSIASNSAFAGFASDVINGFKSKIGSAYTETKSNITTWGSSVLSWFKENCSYDKFYSVASDVISGFKNGIGNLYKTCKDTISSWGSSIIDWFKDKLDSNSPSKVFETIGEDTVLGFNIGLKSLADSTRPLVDSWANSFTNVQPRLAFAVDTSALNYYDPTGYMNTVDTSVNTRANVMATGFIDGMEEFYRDYLEPTLGQIAVDTKRQADKQERTIVQIGTKTISDAVTTQKNADGYSFTK